MPSSRGLSWLRDWTQVSLCFLICFLQLLSIGLQRVGQDCSDLARRHASEKAHILPVECMCLLSLDYGSLFNSFLCETKDLHLVAHSRNSPEISCAPFSCSLFTKNINKSISYLCKKKKKKKKMMNAQKNSWQYRWDRWCCRINMVAFPTESILVPGKLKHLKTNRQAKCIGWRVGCEILLKQSLKASKKCQGKQWGRILEFCLQQKYQLHLLPY